MTLEALYAWILAAMSFLQPHVNHEKLARATANVVYADPPLFLDDDSKLHTAALDVFVMFRESSFRHGITSVTGDHCEMQLHERPDVDDDRERCVREGNKMIRASFRACPGAPLAAYVGGGCYNARARRISDDRFRGAAKLVAEVSP